MPKGFYEHEKLSHAEVEAMCAAQQATLTAKPGEPPIAPDRDAQIRAVIKAGGADIAYRQVQRQLAGSRAADVTEDEYAAVYDELYPDELAFLRGGLGEQPAPKPKKHSTPAQQPRLASK